MTGKASPKRSMILTGGFFIILPAEYHYHPQYLLSEKKRNGPQIPAAFRQNAFYSTCFESCLTLFNGLIFSLGKQPYLMWANLVKESLAKAPLSPLFHANYILESLLVG